MMGIGTFTRTTAPILFGVCLGALLFGLISPSLRLVQDHRKCANKQSTEARSQQFEDESNLNDYEPRLVAQTQPSTKVPASKKKIPRPRFYATELGIKDKLFVGIFESGNDINLQRMIALNKTVAHHVNKIVFFMHSAAKPLAQPIQMNIINLIGENGSSEHSVFIKLVDNIEKNFLENYDWFFLVPDIAYLNAFKLFELVTHLSVTNPIVFGRPAEDAGSKWCDFGAGILLSNKAMRKLALGISACKNEQIDFGVCVYEAAKLPCFEEYNGKIYRSWKLKSETFDVTVEALGRSDNFNSSYTVFPISQAADIYRLHHHFCLAELDQISSLTANVEEEMRLMRSDFPEETTWPYSLPKPWRPKTRYETMKWDFFTNLEIFEGSSDQNFKPLSGINRKDVDSVLNFALKRMTKLSPALQFQRLMGGYRKFDPTRGMEYILDLVFTTDNGEWHYRRVRLMRPLTRVELVQVPYVTESTDIM